MSTPPPCPARTSRPAQPKIEFDIFVELWNATQDQTTPNHHQFICRWLEQTWRAGDRQLLLMAFRNSGKSTLVGLFAAWLLLENPNLRILVLAADLSLARKMVRNVKRVIERHPLTLHLKPKRADQWASEQFTVNRPLELRDPSMLARGIGANVTGSRADIILCDDVEVPNTSDTAAKRLDLRTRLSEIEYVLVPGGLQLYVGTPHTYYTIYAARPRPEIKEDTPFLTNFKRLELPVFDKTGQSRWPERFSVEEIADIKRRSGPNKFKSQMLLEPVNIANARLDPDRVRAYDDDLVYVEANGETRLSLGKTRLISSTCWWDPAYGSPGKGDASVVAALFTDAAGHHYLHALQYLEHQPDAVADLDEASQLCRQVAQFAKRHFVPAITLETNGLGKFLPGLLRRELARAGSALPVVEVHAQRSKDARILDAFDAVLAAGNLSAHRDVFATPFMQEMREWQPGTNGRDDGLDAVAGCLLAEPVRLKHTARQPDRRTDWRGFSKSFQAKSEFQV